MVSILRSPEISANKQSLANLRSKSMIRPSKPSAPVVSKVDESFESTANIKAIPDEEKIKEITEKMRASILAQLKDEVESAKELARQRGLQEGRQAGIEAAKQEFAADLARIHGLSETIKNAVQLNVEGMEDVIVTITFEAVCKIIGKIAHTKDAVQSMVKQVMQECSNANAVLVRLHPADLITLRESGAIDMSDVTQAKVNWIADANLQEGGCKVELEGGVLDARLESQLKALKNALMAARELKTI